MTSTQATRRRPPAPISLSLALSLPVLAIATAPARAERPTPRAVEASVHGGVQAPLFFIYDRPGALAGTTLAWPRGARLQLAGVVDTGVLAASGLRRYTATATAGVRWWLLPERLSLRIGAGAAAYRERIGVVLANRRMHAIDHGAAVVGTAAVGARIGAGWELAARFDGHLAGTRGQDYAGTAVLAFGRRL